MQMFLRFCVLCFCVVLLYAGGTVDVHAQVTSLTVNGGADRVYAVGDTVEIVFTAAHDRNLPAAGVTLTITHGGLTDVVISNDGITDFLGQVTVTGKIIADTGVYIQAEWRPDRWLMARFEPPVIRDVTQEPYLEIVDMTGDEAGVTVGTELTVVFRAGYNGVGRSGIPLRITAGPNINITSPTPVPGTHMTGAAGILQVTGTLQRANVPTHIETFWEVSIERGLLARADIPAGEDPAPLVIVVNPPDPKSPLKVGDTFTQRITIENRDSTRRSSLPLSAWQMDVVYNPLILKVVEVVEGDFLTEGGTVSAGYAMMESRGRIAVSQSRSSLGIFLRPGDRGTLLTIGFELLAAAEEPLGLHNVRLGSGQDDNQDGILDRIVYSILVSDVYRVSTHQSLTEAVFHRYSTTFQHPDVYKFFPDVLRIFKNPEIQNVLNPVVIHHFVRDPEYIRAFYPDVDESIITLLTTDNGFRTLFEDEEFQGVLQEPAEIDELVRLIEAQPQREPRMLTIVSGDLQEGSPQTPLGNPLVVLVRDQDGDALSGVDVTFRVTRGDGSLSRPTARTGRAGRAETTLTLASESGIHQIEASVVGFSSLTQTFTAAAAAVCDVPSPLRPTTLNIVSGNDQSGEVGKPLAQPFVVGMLDQDGKPLQGTAVTFTVTAGSGRLSGHTIHTDVYGQARTTLTLGSGAGRHSVTARATGISQTRTFTATADAPPPPREQEPVVPVRSSTEEPPMYWIADDTIYYRPIGGGEEIFKPPQPGTLLTGGIAVNMEGEKVYWTERTIDNMGRIQSADLDATNVKTVQEILDVPYDIAFDAETRRLYWTTSFGKIQSINVDGTDFRGDFITDLENPQHIAFDMEARRLYWTAADGIWSIYTGNDTGIPRRLDKEDLDKVRGIAVFDDVVYWTEQTSSGGRVRSMNRAGSGDKLLAVTESIPAGIAVDPVGGRVYWTTSRGEIQSASLTGAQTVVIREDEPAGIALGGAAVVWAPTAPSAPSISPAISVENTLLANYPNPFNPETWIPYQLSESADVSMSIYAVDGHLVRRLDLGHQVAGVYRSRSRAAYWDGRNEFGERIASGLYFYTLTAGDFTATRKMLIRK